MVQNRINENVKVYALYEDNRSRESRHERLQPIMFVWRNREYRVEDITYVWREKQGEADVYHYAVSDGTNVFELSYQTSSLDWTLSSVTCEG